jgi:hypothetical protein
MTNSCARGSSLRSLFKLFAWVAGLALSDRQQKKKVGVYVADVQVQVIFRQHMTAASTLAVLHVSSPS